MNRINYVLNDEGKSARDIRAGVATGTSSAREKKVRVGIARKKKGRLVSDGMRDIRVWWETSSGKKEGRGCYLDGRMSKL
jgi:hypothetical protein